MLISVMGPWMWPFIASLPAWRAALNSSASGRAISPGGPGGAVQMGQEQLLQKPGALLDHVEATVEKSCTGLPREWPPAADGGGHQGLGNAGHDGGAAAPLGQGQVLEGMDDAQDGAEQADEGGALAPRVPKKFSPLPNCRFTRIRSASMAS